jgi:hypothetical protein
MSKVHVFVVLSSKQSLEDIKVRQESYISISQILQKFILVFMLVVFINFIYELI